MFNPDDIVWVNLGKSYGWWPAQVQNTDKKAKLSKSIIEDLGIDFRFSDDTPPQAQEESGQKTKGSQKGCQKERLIQSFYCHHNRNFDPEL